MRRSELVPIVVVYILPVGLASVGLALAGLGVLAVALLVIEAAVGTAVVLARRRPDTPSGPTTRPWLVPTVMIAALGLMAVIAVVASRSG